MAQISAETTLDELRLIPVPVVPEIKLRLAQDAIIFWARLEAEAGTTVAAPYWASAWAGGQALARYVLDNPQTVKGKRVLDLASGSGLVAIAAALAGAAEVTANDIDPSAIAAISENATDNSVAISVLPGDLLRQDVDGYDVVMAGDGLYSADMARVMLPFLRAQRAKGVEILLGDPGRGHLPLGELQPLATYPLTLVLADCEIKSAMVFRLR